MADRTGQHLGNYRLVRLLGQGGFAEVYLGEHLHLGTEAALKLLHTQLGSEDTDAFRQEARTIARLIHPHIVRVLDFGIDGTTPYLIMDYAPKGTLRQRHPKGVPLPLPTILNYVKQTASALQYAHDAHLVHRDVKPENLLLGRQEEVLLGDFGIALLAQTSRSQSTRDVAGTASYMAPEQLQGKPRPASDQYALAIMVYEWLTGACPFHGSFTEIASQHLFVPPPSLQEKVPGLSPELEQVVMTALVKDPYQRFASVQAFATAFEQASQVESSPTELAVTSRASVLATTLAAPDQPVPATEQADIASSLPSTVYATPASPASSLLPTQVAEVPSFNPPSVLAPRQQVQHSPSQDKLLILYRGHENYVTGLAWSPDSTRVASGSMDQLVVWDAATGKNQFECFLWNGNTSSPSSGLAWSPDGQRIASTLSSVFLFDAATGRMLIDHKAYGAQTVAWSPDSTRVAFNKGVKTGDSDQEYSHEVQVWDVTTDHELMTYTGHQGTSIASLTWSPDGKHIASTSIIGMDGVHVWDVQTGRRVFVYQNDKFSRTSVPAWSPDGKRIAFVDRGDSIQVWSTQWRRRLAACQGHKINSLAWSPDSKRIVTGSDDTTVQVWDASTGRTLALYQGHTEAVNIVAWSPDGTRIASGSGGFENSTDNSVRIWRAP